MNDLKYDFNSSLQRNRRRGDSWGRRVRLTVLFCAVAAITGAVIYAIIPSKEKAMPVKPVSGSDITRPAAVEKVDVPQVAPVQPPPVTPVTPVTPVQPPQVPERSGSADTSSEKELYALAAAGQYKEFFAAAGKKLDATAPDSESRARLGAIVTAEHKKLWANGKWKEFAVIYRVVAGDYLSKIAKKQFTTVDMISKGNGLKDSRIGIGKKLYILPGPWKVVIAVKAQLLSVIRTVDGKDSVFAVFPVTIAGKPQPGEYIIWERAFLDEAVIRLMRKDGKRRRIIQISQSDANVPAALRKRNFQMAPDDLQMLYRWLPARTAVSVIE